MNLLETDIAGIWTIETSAIEDHRGAFSRLFCSEAIDKILDGKFIVQINHSLTHHMGAVRGLHYQNQPYAEMKIIRCLKGRVFDVAVDLREGSPTFLHWTSLELSPKNNLALTIPEGCAHGFQVLEPDSELLYLHTALYTPSAEGAVRFDDPKININWPLTPTHLSARDLAHSFLSEDFKGIAI